MSKTMQTVEFKIEGMTCGGCVRRVEAGLKGLEAVKVEKVEIGRARVAFDPDRTTVIVLNTAISEMGFKATIAGT